MNLGNLKFRIERLQGYSTIPTTIITLFASLKILDVSYWWILSLIPFAYLLHLADKKWIYPAQADRMFRDNPLFMKLFDELKKK